MKNYIAVICGNYRKFEKSKIYFLEKLLVVSIVCSKCENEDEKYLKKKNQLRY